jgi:ubiquinone/menaquinone biosynthesis C-methylase UbiE/transcription elongation factor Elf1
MKAAYRNCPICKSGQMSKQIELDVYDFDDVSLERNLVIVSCENCGMIYNGCRVDDNDLDSYYENDAVYDSVEGVGSGGLTQWDVDRYNGYLEFFEAIPVNKDIMLTDVGCARGGFLAYLREHGFTAVSGVEINPRCAQYALTNYSVHVDIGAANKLPLPDNSRDFLTYNHVFEHVNDLYRVIKEANRVLKKDGMLFIDVPDASRYGDCSISNFYPASIREHINHFDVYHLQMVLKIAGFDCVKCDQRLASYQSRFVLPTIAGVFRKSTIIQPQHPVKIVRNDALIKSFAKYIEDGHFALNNSRKLVSEIERSNKPVYVWGLGLEFFGLYGMAGIKDCNVKKLIDKNLQKQSRKVDGLEVVGPEILLNVPDNSCVFLTSAQHKDDMLTHLKKIQFRGEVIPLS